MLAVNVSRGILLPRLFLPPYVRLEGLPRKNRLLCGLCQLNSVLLLLLLNITPVLPFAPLFLTLRRALGSSF